ncbi:putative lipid-transfer protein DIR1 [Salvia splendens]|uniref:putative lipid-transfer protein DIR1 n=1 Tax=Salvia splendens TaxID=180675 RepID=UPI001C27749A|nr:putative lipid-transfer protein DIR1 [Salvia splendens]
MDKPSPPKKLKQSEFVEMEASKTLLILALVMVSAAAVTAARARADDDGSICGVTRSELMECKPAVATGTATPPKPTAACCGSLKHANLTCFCSFKNNAYLPLFGINATRAMQLPTTCDATQTASCA